MIIYSCGCSVLAVRFLTTLSVLNRIGRGSFASGVRVRRRETPGRYFPHIHSTWKEVGVHPWAVREGVRRYTKDSCHNWVVEEVACWAEVAEAEPVEPKSIPKRSNRYKWSLHRESSLWKRAEREERLRIHSSWGDFHCWAPIDSCFSCHSRNCHIHRPVSAREPTIEKS